MFTSRPHLHKAPLSIKTVPNRKQELKIAPWEIFQVKINTQTTRTTKENPFGFRRNRPEEQQKEDYAASVSSSLRRF